MSDVVSFADEGLACLLEYHYFSWLFLQRLCLSSPLLSPASALLDALLVLMDFSLPTHLFQSPFQLSVAEQWLLDIIFASPP